MKSLVDKFLSIFFNMDIIGSTLIVIALLFVIIVLAIYSIREYRANEEEYREKIVCQGIETITVLGMVAIGEVAYILICYYHPEFLSLFK